MAREEERPVQYSILDRLTGPDTDGSGITRMQSVRDLKASVRRDLEWLLNTRSIAIPPPEALAELKSSVYTYGLGDITSFSADDPKSRVRLRRMIEEAIATFEPRLTAVQVAEAGLATRESRQLRFSIQALLRMDPSPERVSFDTVLDVASGQYVVRENPVRDDLLEYYERELTYLRQLGAEFAARYPKVASRLQLEPTKCEDPHVERLLEGFAFLAARVHLKIDDDLPEISQSLMELVFPHYVRPIPSISIVQFHADPEQGKMTTGFQIPRQSLLYSRNVGGTPCKFRTCFDTTIWPVNIASAEWKTPERIRPMIRTGPEVAAVLRLEVRCLQDITFPKLELQSLRIFLNADSGVAYSLYELLANNCRQILVRDLTPGSKKPPVVLPPSVLRPTGFEEDQSLLPYPQRSFAGYRLLQEYFAFPQKFLFFELGGFDKVAKAGFNDAVEVLILLSPFERHERQQSLEVSVSSEAFRLGCSPVINLFEQTSEPILMDQTRHEYLVVPDARRKATTEVFSIDQVLGVKPNAAGAVPYAPFYSYHHESGSRAFWFANRRPCGWRSDGSTDMYVSFVDLSGQPSFPDEDSITLRLTCFNRDLPSRLPFGNEGGDFELEGGGPILKVVALLKPTNVMQAPLGKSLHWRLISQLSLNYLSIVDGGTNALREILRLYNFGDFPYNERQIQGISAVSSRPVLTQITSEDGVSFVRGRRIEVEFDEEQFAGGGVYLFANLLERFLGLYVSMNSFTVLAARTRQRKEPFRQWPPRTGNRILV